VWERIVEEVKAGHQAYVVVPRIASQEDKDLKPGQRQAIALEDLAPQLTEGPLAEVRVGIMHGQMPGVDKDDVMQRFANGPAHKDGIDVFFYNCD
jgi:ATP-dependent DNA helicase RecG